MEKWVFMHSFLIDFHKAFDLADQGIVMRKQAELQMTKRFCMWTQSFQEGRSQQVKLVDTVSSVKPCPGGVPKGSVISPILLNVHVNDLQESVP